MSKRALVAIAVLVCLSAGGLHDVARAEDPPVAVAEPGVDAVIRWSEATAEATLLSGITPYLNPLHETRLLAMVHIAIHDALNAIERRSRPYALEIGRWPDASPDAAVAAAARDVLVPAIMALPAELEPDVEAAVAHVEATAAAELAAVPEGPAKQRGVFIGEAAAAVINAARVADGAEDVYLDTSYPEGTEPGKFRFVEGAPFAAAPRWGEVTPFVMRSGSQFRSPRPHNVIGVPYAEDFNEIKSLGALDSTTRTADQEAAARAWFESSPLRWNRIARTVALGAGLDAWGHARLLGLLNLALADGYIANWDAKYEYDAWRPETAIRLADTDGNPLTEADPDWLPLWGSSGATPEHDSGHAIEGAAGATVLERFFGTDRKAFSICSASLPIDTCTDDAPVLRSYTSFSEAARENAESRIWMGWHFRKAIEDGMVVGEAIANRTFERYLRPDH
jgi:hypothetical protein